MNDKSLFSANELFRKLCHRDPTQSEIKLFDNFKIPQSGPKPSSLTVSSKYRQDICQNSSNPAEFEKVYQQLHKANVKELDPFVAFLYSIKKNPEIVEMLRQTCESETSNKNDQNISLERIKSVNKTSNSSILSKSTIPSSVSSMSSNPFITMDFVDISTLMLPPWPTVPINALDIPAQEKALIKDLIYCLMGDHGIYIKALPSTASERQFDIDSSLYPGFEDLVKSILSVASDVSTVYKFVDDYHKYEHGNVNQALTSAINSQIKDFRLLVCQMEEIFLRGNLTLQGMLNYIKEPGDLMRCIANICQDIVKFKSRGGAVLSMFYHHGLTAGNPKRKALVNHLMKCSTVPFFRILKIWIFRGIISDPYQEFFIKDNNVRPTESAISQAYWANNYSIENTLVPRFLEMHVEKILHTGKYLNVIQLCDGDAAFPDVEDMIYEDEEQHYIVQIDQAYQYASKLLLNIMFKDKKLKDYFQLMKHFFLLDQADWLSNFMYSANDEMNEKISDCQKSRLESLLDVAIQASGTSYDTLKENITVELSNQELIPFIFRIMKYDPRSTATIKGQTVTGQNLRVLEAFSLNITTEWPISLVFNSVVVQQYQILFRHLFYCHHVERVLLQVWSSNKCSSTGHMGNFHLINKASVLGNNMRTFIQHLIYYMTTEVIEPFWIIFKNKLDQAQNLDEVLKFHDEFLQSSLVNCIGPVEMLKNLQKMMVLCVNYANRLNRLRSSSQDKKDDSFESFKRQTDTEDIAQMYDAKSFEDIIDRDEATFTHIAKNLIDIIRREIDNKMLLKLVDRMEFNGFYDASSANESDIDA